MKRSLKTAICLLVCIVFMFSMFVGCNKSQNKEETSTPSSQAASSEQSSAAETSQAGSSASTEEAALKLPLVEPGSATLTIGTFDNWYAPASFASNLPIYQEIEKKTGVKIKWEVAPPAQWQTQMQTRLAAGGDDIPDYICIPWGDTMKDALAGLVVPLEDLVAKYAPNMTRFFNANPDVKALNYAPDGHMYKISSVVTGSTYINPYCLSIRQDWLDKLKLKAPETIDDWYTVLKAFKTQDPNGNNKADEIPFTGVGPTIYYISRFAESWGLHPFYSSLYYPDSSGKIQPELISDRYKEFLTWMNKLYTDGLLDAEFSSLDSEKQTAKINRNIVGSVGTFISNVPSFNKNLEKGGFTGAHYVGLVNPKGPYGDQFMEGYGPISGDFGITKNCKQQELAIKWIDYVYASQEGSDFCMFGVDGKSYTVENGQKKLTDYVLNNPDGLGPFEALRALGSWPNIAYIQTEEAYKALFAPFPELLDTAAKCKPFIKLGIPPILATKEESDEFNAVSADLQTYIDETVLKFVIGKEPLTNWDKYVQKVKDLGVDKIVKIKQAQWDRFQAQMAATN